MKRITRDRQLTPQEAAKYKAIRAQVAEELGALIVRHDERSASTATSGHPLLRVIPLKTVPKPAKNNTIG